MFARDGIRGAYIEASGLLCGDPIDLCLMFKLMDNPALDTEAVLEEFFTLYYGSAAKPMRELYLAIEETYSNPDNYPEAVRRQTEWEFEQTEEMAWGYLGTAERMAGFGKLMEQAKASAASDVDKRRVELFEKGVWEHMLKGRRRYLEKYDPAAVEKRKQQEACRGKLKAAPLPSLSIPAMPDGDGGDPLKIDWANALTLNQWSTVAGDSTGRVVAARLLHDRRRLYMRLEETTDTSKLVGADPIWSGDDWELFFAPRRGQEPYRQIAVSPDGRSARFAYGEQSKEWASDVKVFSDMTAPDRWMTTVVFPLETLLPGGLKIGHKFYANFYRASPKNGVAPQEALAWSPNFDESFHKLDRLGEFELK
jgi:hypothetical protein